MAEAVGFEPTSGGPLPIELPGNKVILQIQ